jgi:hypothetical protein
MHGSKDWPTIARAMPGLIARQCRDRYSLQKPCNLASSDCCLRIQMIQPSILLFQRKISGKSHLSMRTLAIYASRALLYGSCRNLSSASIYYFFESGAKLCPNLLIN